jgi:hypothetical protein
VGEIMKKTGTYLILSACLFLTVMFSLNSWAANDAISILNYSLKPAGYVDNDKYLQTIYNMELKNNQATDHSFNVKIVFFDKENNQLKSSKKKFDIQANETKKLTDALKIDADIAKKVASTKGYIEDVE